MGAPLSEFITNFVIPLHEGGPIAIGAPFSIKERDAMSADASALTADELRLARLRRARAFAPVDDLADPTHQELSGWLGLYNVLALDHPDAERVWARDSTWELAGQVTAALLNEAMPHDEDAMLSRHLAVEGFLAAQRVDVVARVGEGERRFSGRAAPRTIRRLAGAGQAEVYEETVRWSEQVHSGRVATLLPTVMRTSPLTCLVHPLLAPRGWDPTAVADFLRRPGTARAIVYGWARERDWIAVGGEVVAAVLGGLRGGGEADNRDIVWAEIQDDEAPAATGRRTPASRARALGPAAIDPRDVAPILGALIHLHVLRVLAFDARVGLAGHRRRGRMRAFLALPLLLPHLEGVLGDPLVGVSDPALLRRWDDYLEGLRGLITRPWIDNLVATLVQPVVQGFPA